MTSTVPEDAQSPPCLHNNDTNLFSFSTYVDSNTADNNRIKENNKKNISANAYPDYFKYDIDFNEYLKGVPDNEYINYFEGFNEIRRLDHILFEKIVKEKEVKMQSVLLKKQLFEELEKIKKTGRIEMRDEKANTEKFFALNYSPKHQNSNKKDDTTDSIFAYSPVFKTELQKPEGITESDSSRSISSVVNEYTEKKTQDLIFDNEDHLLEDFENSNESIKDKILPSELSLTDIAKDVDSVKSINEVSNEGLKDVTTDKKYLNQDVIDILAPISPHDFKLVQVTSDNSWGSTPTNVNPDQMSPSVGGSIENINREPLIKGSSDVVLDKVVLSNTSSSQNINNKSLNQSPCGQVVLSGTDSSQNINNESPNNVPTDGVLDQVVLSNKGSCQSINIESPHETPKDEVLDQMGLSNTCSGQIISSESPAQAPNDIDSDQVGLNSEGLSQYSNNKLLNQSPSDLVGLSETDLGQSLREVVPSEIQLSLSNESLNQLELSEMSSSQVKIKEMTPSQDEEPTHMKKKTKKNFIKRNIQLAKDADSAVSMTPEEKNRIENLLQDLDTLCETPKELQISDLATKDSLLSQREDGFLSSREDKASLAEIDYKLRYLMTPSEFEMVALKHHSPTPTQRMFNTVVQPSCDIFGLKQFGEKTLLDTKEERNMKERMKKIDEQLYNINTRDVCSGGSYTLEADALQDLLESCAVSLTESAANSLCTTARSTNSSLDEDLMLPSNLSQQSPSDVLSSVMKSPPCLADDVLQTLLAEAAPMKYNPLSPISDLSNTPDHNIFRSCSNLSSCTLSSFNSPRKELINSNMSASPSKVQDYSLPELSCRASLVGHDVSSPESTSTQ